MSDWRAEADARSHAAWDAMRAAAVARGGALSALERRVLRSLRFRERTYPAADPVLNGLEARGVVASTPVSRALAGDPSGDLAEWRVTADGYDVLAANGLGAVGRLAA